MAPGPFFRGGCWRSQARAGDRLLGIQRLSLVHLLGKSLVRNGEEIQGIAGIQEDQVPRREERAAGRSLYASRFSSGYRLGLRTLAARRREKAPRAAGVGGLPGPEAYCDVLRNQELGRGALPRDKVACLRTSGEIAHWA